MFQTFGCKITNNHSITQTFYAFFLQARLFIVILWQKQNC